MKQKSHYIFLKHHTSLESRHDVEQESTGNYMEFSLITILDKVFRHQLENKITLNNGIKELLESFWPIINGNLKVVGK